MPNPADQLSAASIAENLLKRKWSVPILRYISEEIRDPAKISDLQPELSREVLAERLRALVRYRLIARFPRPRSSPGFEYMLTPRGKKILTILDILDQIDREP